MSDFVIFVVGAMERNPVIQVRRLIVVIVRVVVILPYVLLGVHVVLVKVPVHVNVSETILQLGVVVVGNWSERIEQIWVNLRSLGHRFPLLLLRLLFTILHVWLNHIEVNSEKAWIGKEVQAVTHATKRT